MTAMDPLVFLVCLTMKSKQRKKILQNFAVIKNLWIQVSVFTLEKMDPAKKSTVALNMIDYSGIIIVKLSSTNLKRREASLFFIIKVVEKYRYSHEQNNHCTSDLFNSRTYISCFSLYI